MTGIEETDREKDVKEQVMLAGKPQDSKGRLTMRKRFGEFACWFFSAQLVRMTI